MYGSDCSNSEVNFVAIRFDVPHSPASVSDACDNLVKQMNKLRSFETVDDPWKTNADQFFNVDRHTFTQKNPTTCTSV